ncbi:uncharacterized protein LOC144770423 isoform X2 [Lissotriton helveticus]
MVRICAVPLKCIISNMHYPSIPPICVMLLQGMFVVLDTPSKDKSPNIIVAGDFNQSMDPFSDRQSKCTFNPETRDICTVPL